ncbi:MAG: ATP-dependent DNA helicase RecG [Acidobacteria bacterium]|nr:ATP-dependent DNA helicase RecG [Acidobacteriota bacterium]
MDFSTPLMYVKGVGPARAEVLETKGLRTVGDLLAYAPFRYEDRSNVKAINTLAPGEMATVLARIHTATTLRMGRFAKRPGGMFEAVLVDDSGGRLVAKWFNGSFLSNILVPGMTLAVYGRIDTEGPLNRLVMLHPEFEILREDEEESDAGLHTGRIVPIYEAIGKISTKVLRQLTSRALETTEIPPDPLPEHIRASLGLCGLREALREIHFPAAGSDMRAWNASRSPAHFRLIFEEFFWLECGLAFKRAQARKAEGIRFELNDQIREKLKLMLPFKPTGAQKRVLKEIAGDMVEAQPMNRLLQGDVGSGKTLVAAEAAVIAIENGYQCVLLAPTEILAAQHYHAFKKLFAKVGYPVILLTGSQGAKEKATLKRMIAAGVAKMIIGTHAVLTENVEFDKLGLAIVDEQHRFGVMQRLKLFEKGVHPDVLVMTATPIPRTLALTIYGDLDTSVIDEMPPGRMPIQTMHVPEGQVAKAWKLVRSQLQEGRQAYVVYPVIEEAETVSMKAAQKMHEHLSQVEFPDFRVGLLHGKLRTEEKERVMDEFQRGEIDILVSTTVIEVGVDVPNATVMVIEHAERFGLAQLHQLRGRVGRGAAQSYCVLVTGSLGETAQERVKTMVESNDGFQIAETDLRLRGPGEFFGTKQSGLPALRIANIIRDREILEMARGEAHSFIASPPSEDDRKRALEYIRDNWQRRYGLVQVG